MGMVKIIVIILIIVAFLIQSYSNLIEKKPDYRAFQLNFAVLLLWLVLLIITLK